MRVLILGAGRVGYSIARYLAYEEFTDYHVTVVDNNLQVLEKLSEKLDVQPIFGHASNPDVLEQAGCKEADLVIAVTASDEVNLVACNVAKTLFDISLKIARVRSSSYLSPKWSHLFTRQARIISPENEIAKSLERSSEVVGAFFVVSVCHEAIKVVGVRALPNAQVLNTPIRLLPTVLSKIEISILTITRDGKTIFPSEHDEIREGDEVFFASENNDVSLCMEAFGYFDHIDRHILVIGGGNIGYSFAQNIEKLPNMDIKIIERDEKRCEFLARNLQKSKIFRGDALDTDILQNMNLKKCESVIAVTNDDKVNILSSLMMKRQGAERCSALLNNDQYTSLVTSLGIDSVISPKAVTVSTILQNIRRVETIHTIADGFAELIEVKALETSHIIGLSVEDVCSDNDIDIIALYRDDITHFTPSRMIISVNDLLLVLSRKESVKKVDRLFAARRSYL